MRERNWKNVDAGGSPEPQHVLEVTGVSPSSMGHAREAAMGMLEASGVEARAVEVAGWSLVSRGSSPRYRVDLEVEIEPDA